MALYIKSILQLSDISNPEEENISQEDIFLDMTNWSIKDWDDLLKHKHPINLQTNDENEEKISIDLTILDLFNLPYETNDEIEKFIKDRLKINLSEKSWIEKINLLFNKALIFYRERYNRTLPAKFEKMKFWTKDSVIKFIKETKTNKRTWILNCAIAKIAYTVDDILSNEKIWRTHLLDRKFIDLYLQKPLQILESYQDSFWNIYEKWKVIIDDKVINFSIIAREKRENSIMWKEISDPKYFSIDEFKDMVWTTFYVENETEAIKIMQYLDQMIFKWNADISNKNRINDSDLKNCELNSSFLKKIKCSLWNNEWKEITSEDYKEIKLKWFVDLPLENWENSSKISVWTEIKFVIWWHDNEKGLNLHAIYDYQKRFWELTRLWLPIREIDILNYVNNFFEKIDSILMKKNKIKEVYYEELLEGLKKENCIDKSYVMWKYQNENEKILALGLYKYFKSKLVQFKIKWSNKIYYMDERFLKLKKFIK